MFLKWRHFAFTSCLKLFRQRFSKISWLTNNSNRSLKTCVMTFDTVSSDARNKSIIALLVPTLTNPSELHSAHRSHGRGAGDI